MKFEFKKDPGVIALMCVAIIVAGALVWHGDLTVEKAFGLLLLVLAPSPLGKSKEEPK